MEPTTRPSTLRKPTRPSLDIEAAQLLGTTRNGVKRRIIKHRIEWPRASSRPPAAA